MAAQWHYTKGSERHGPVSSDQLRQLAASGQLQPTDLVWKDGMAEWQKASAVKGLFPPQASGPTEPPPIPKDQRQPVAGTVSATVSPAAAQSEKRGLLGTLSSLGQAAKTAAVAAAKGAERTKITNIDLPKAYAVLGRDVHGRGAYRDEFSDFYRQIDDLLARLRNLEGDPSKQPNPPATLTDKAKAAALATKKKAEAQAIGIQISRLMSKFGEAVYQRHGTAAGSPETTGPIATLLSKASSPVTETEQQPAGGRFITRRRVVVAVVACVGIALLVPAIESAREASRKGKVATSGSEAMTGGKSKPDAKIGSLTATRADDAKDADLTLKNGPIPIDAFFKQHVWANRTTPPEGLDPAGTPVEFVLAYMRHFKPPYRIHMQTRKSRIWGTDKFRELHVVLLQAEEDRKWVGMACVCNADEKDSVGDLYTTVNVECLPGFNLRAIVNKDTTKVFGKGLHERYGKAEIHLLMAGKELRGVVSVPPENSASQDTPRTEDEMIQSTAYMALAACVWGDRLEDAENQVEQIKRKWLETTPERFHAYFLATAKNLGAGKNANSRFLLALEPRQVRKTSEGMTGILLDYGADTKVTFVRGAGKDAFSMISASISGVEYGLSNPAFVRPPPALRQTSKSAR